jgi:hypothetical protein
MMSLQRVVVVGLLKSQIATASTFNVTRDDVTRDVFPKFNGKGDKEPII